MHKCAESMLSRARSRPLLLIPRPCWRQPCSHEGGLENRLTAGGPGCLRPNMTNTSRTFVNPDPILALTFPQATVVTGRTLAAGMLRTGPKGATHAKHLCIAGLHSLTGHPHELKSTKIAMAGARPCCHPQLTISRSPPHISLSRLVPHSTPSAGLRHNGDVQS